MSQSRTTFLSRAETRCGALRAAEVAAEPRSNPSRVDTRSGNSYQAPLRMRTIYRYVSSWQHRNCQIFLPVDIRVLAYSDELFLLPTFCTNLRFVSDQLSQLFFLPLSLLEQK